MCHFLPFPDPSLRPSFVALERQDLLRVAAPGATVLLNAPYPPEEIWDRLPRAVQATVIAKKLRLFTIDAGVVAREVGLGARTNTVLQTCFFATRAQLAQSRLDLAALQPDYVRGRRQVAMQRAQVESDQATFDRYAALVGSRAVARERYDDTRFKLQADQAAMGASTAQMNVTLARLGRDAGAAVTAMPAYQLAAARLGEAERALRHATVRAAFSGVVTEVNKLAPGQYLAAGTPAFGLVDTHNLWMTSQPKETALQLILDRGEIKDWFGSTEIIIEAVTALAGFYLFGVHMLTGERRVITPSMFRSLNYVTGVVKTFVIGMVLLASTALMAPWLQELGGYPVEVAGLLLAPRGIGTLLAMVAAAWLSNRVDARLLMALGVGLMSFSLLRLYGWSPAINKTSLFFNTRLQGAGMALVFVPLNVLAFATLPAHLRYEGTALIALARNFGSSIGISVFEALLTRNTIVEHAALAPSGSPLNRALTVTQAISHAFLPTSPYGAARFDHLMTVQAQVIAYNNDYRPMGLTALPILLLLPLLCPPPLVTKI